MRKNVWKVLIVVVLAVMALYSLAGFVLAPRIVKHWIETSISASAGHRLVVEGVSVNPFTLVVFVTNVTRIGPESKALSSIARVESDFGLVESVRRGALHGDVALRDIRVATAGGETGLTVADVSATGVLVDTTNRVATLHKASVRRPVLRIRRDAAGRLSGPAWPAAGLSPALHFDRIEIVSGQLRFTDLGYAPAVRLDVGAVSGAVQQRHGEAGASLAVTLRGETDWRGDAELTAELPAAGAAAAATVETTLRGIDLSRLSPYFAAIAGRSITGGTGELRFRVDRHDDEIHIDNRLVADDLQLGPPAAAKIVAAPDIDLALALLTDADGRIDVAVPVPSVPAAAELGRADLFAGALRHFIAELSADPFAALADAAGGAGEAPGRIAFAPGSAEIAPAAGAQLERLRQALQRRPGVGLRAHPAYDPVADRQALAVQQVRLHVTLATSAGPPGRLAGTPVDVDDPKVRTVLDEFAEARLPPAARAAIAEHFDNEDTGYYRAVFAALVEHEPVPDSALRRLARYRAQAVRDALAEPGIDDVRLLRADAMEIVANVNDSVRIRLEAWAATTR
ncbi:MAG: DUF748 domain-containing protein [Pseudomonadota bacterium]